MICGKVIPALEDSLAATNPTLILEVTSPSTEAYDRGAKLEHYRGLDGLEEILVVAHDQRRIELHRRGPDGKWTLHTASEGQTLELASVGARLEVSAVYRALD